MIKLIIVVSLLGASNFACAQENNELPEPLTFESALSYAAKEYNHTFLLTQSDIDVAKANGLMAESTDDLTVNLKGYFRKVGVSDVGNSDRDNDSKISLIIKKPLYDFGLSSSKEKYSDLSLQAELIKYKLKRDQYLNKVVAAYFDVLRSDNNYLTQNEAMSIAFIRFKRAQDNIEFGLSSDLDILKAQSHYESVRQQRYLSEVQQRYSRQYLAELLSSKTVPDLLEFPSFDSQRKIIDDVDLIINQALINSNEINLNRARVSAAKQSIISASHTQSAKIEAEFEVSDYARESSFRDDWRASINFNVPLYSGDKEGSVILLAQAKHKKALAELSQAQSTLRIKILGLWQKISQRTVELDGAVIKQEYRDLYLEQSRADYELEYKSDLGDAMVEFSRSRSQRYEIEFDLEIAWRELLSLVGQKNLDMLVKK